MATKPLTTEIIALTEKKMDMTLDEIIKMGKGDGNKAKKQHRPANKSQGFLKNAVNDRSAKGRRYIDSRSSVRQGFLAQRRSNFQGNHFPVTNEVARKAANAPFRNKAFGHSQVATHWKPRVGPHAVQRRPGNGRFAAKPPQKPPQQNHEATTIAPKQRPRTLDSLFANMKEERMRTAFSRTNNAAMSGFQAQQRNRGGQQRPHSRRGRYGN